jgi:hypothetical protein
LKGGSLPRYGRVVRRLDGSLRRLPDERLCHTNDAF